MNRKTVLIGIVVLAALFLAVASYFVYTASTTSPVPAGGGNGGLAVSVKPSDHTLGNPKAPVTMVEYAAPVCPHCAHWTETVFPKLKANYIDTGKVYYVFRVFPLRPVDVAVEAMGRCMPQGTYFQFMDMMFRNQPMWDPDGYNIPDVHAALVHMGRIAGLSASQVNTCITNQDELKKISAAGEHAQKAYGINGTPTFIIDGQIQPQAVTWQGLQDVLNAQLKAKGAK